MSERACDVFDLGRIPYLRAERLQQRMCTDRRAGLVPDTLLLCEHDPIITVGRSCERPEVEVDAEAARRAGVAVRRVSRGGRATFHGPGQLVGYPILDLREHRADLHWYLRRLEGLLIRALELFGYQARRAEGWTGVWVGDQKVASIGIAVRGWVTYHGFALNTSCRPRWWDLVDPCGLGPGRMASLADLHRPLPQREELAAAVVEEFGRAFDLRPRRRDTVELLAGKGF